MLSKPVRGTITTKSRVPCRGLNQVGIQRWNRLMIILMMQIEKLDNCKTR